MASITFSNQNFQGIVSQSITVFTEAMLHNGILYPDIAVLAACISVALAMILCQHRTKHSPRNKKCPHMPLADRPKLIAPLESILSIPLKERSELIVLLNNFPSAVRVTSGPVVRKNADAFGIRYTVFNKRPMLSEVIAFTPSHDLKLTIAPEFAIRIPRTRADAKHNTLKLYTTNDFWYDLKRGYISLVQD